MMFSDRLTDAIAACGSPLLAGADPVIEKFPSYLVNDVARAADSDSDFVDRSLARFTDVFIAGVSGIVCAVKPNIAFFEQYGLPGIAGFARFCERARQAGLQVIVDGKRGDIGSTAEAYSSAFLGRATIRGRQVAGFDADALTINPFLGFDTIEPFLRDCIRYEKGIFILVQTSNPGAGAIQSVRDGDGPVCEKVMRWIGEQAASLKGDRGWSGLGAVVGATYPDSARRLRELAPNSYFLIPGFGAQGGKAVDALAGFGRRTSQGSVGGGIVNVSRGLLEGSATSDEEFTAMIRSNAVRYGAELNAAMNALS